MVNWVVSVTAVALLSFLCEIILPEGSTKKYVSTVMGVVVSFVVVTPLLTTLKNFSVDFTQSNTEIEVQQRYVDYAKLQKSTVQQDVEQLLNQKGYVVCNITLTSQKTVVIYFDDKYEKEKEQNVLKTLKDNYDDYNFIVKWK